MRKGERVGGGGLCLGSAHVCFCWLLAGGGGGRGVTKMGIKNVAVAVPCFQDDGLPLPKSWLATDPGNCYPVLLCSGGHFSLKHDAPERE